MTARRLLAVGGLALLAAGWIVAAVQLWDTSVPSDLDRPDLDPARYFGDAILDESADYEAFLSVMALLASLAQIAVLGWYAARGAKFARESAAGRVGTGILLGMLGFAFVWLAQFPFDLASHWWQRRYETADENYIEWLLTDWLTIGGEFLFISLALAVVMGVAAVLRNRWWLAGGPALVGVGVAFTFVQPYLIPDQREPRDPRLRADAQELARAEGIPGTPVRVQEVHELTSAPNAEAAGFGSTKRVILWDTLIREFDRDEVRVVVAHELGHLSRDHILKTLAWMALLAIPIGLVVETVSRRRGGLYQPEAVPVALFALVTVLFVLSPVQNAFSRQLETEADWVALQTTRAPEAAEGLFKGFTRIALSQPDPPGWAQQLHGTHPSVMDRLELVEAWRSTAR